MFMVQRQSYFVECTRVIMGIPVLLMIIDQRGVSIMYGSVPEPQGNTLRGLTMLGDRSGSVGIIEDRK